ncbi:hypothetical protein RL72_01147 [Microbacterium azadirachtae]|uniref:Uncharacterized protein n=1 Tax=Microbacterium azadirachtae TaxID=582680 RepID=A0A0F0KZ98_9MICO|nr:hypothetical protein [Microbacterium azadirachtae]KJL26212.1 hypothetical protein RL72_01147 [Microbacterium azadirachtae]
MSTNNTMTLRDQQIETADAWTSIPAYALPCGACGIAVQRPVDDSALDVLSVYRPAQGVHGPERVDLLTTRCETCRLLRAVALDLLSANADLRRRIGDPEIAADRLESALDALDIVGITSASTIDRLTGTMTALLKLMDTLTIPGGSAAWTLHARAAGYSGAPRTPANHSRWEHVPEGQRQVLRDAVAPLLARDVARPVDVFAPSDDDSPSGCLLCGVGAVHALREDAESVWTLMSADSVAIGGRPMPDTLDGVVCPRCDAAIDRAQGVGQQAMALSVRDFLGMPHYLRSLEHIDGLIGWAALPQGTQPNAHPWDHIDLSQIRESVNALLGYQPVGA